MYVIRKINCLNVVSKYAIKKPSPEGEGVSL